jgi:large subunit ribosomal protein L3
MGSVKATAVNLDLVKIDVERNLLLVKGAIPGAKNGDLVVKPTVKN